MNDSSQDNLELLFLKEWENILTLLMKEKSLDTLLDEIIAREASLLKCSQAIILYNDLTSFNNISYKIFNKKALPLEESQYVKEIVSRLPFLLKWLSSHNRPLIANKDDMDNIGYGLLELGKAEQLILLPCLINEELLAIKLLFRPGEGFSPEDILKVEQFASLLAFTISHNKTVDLNTALTAKLNQAQKLETIGKLASGMAHDFNNLLSSIFASLNLLRQKTQDDEKVKYLIDNIENCSIRARDLTKGLLSYGKPTPKRKTLIKPGELLDELLKVILQTFPNKIKIAANIEGDLLDILGDSTEIYQVLLNICINAKEAIHGTGAITLNASNFMIDEKISFDYPLLNKGKYIKISISDNGEGIDEENLSKIFDPYFSTKLKDTGSGLGLYVAYGIIKAHNGHIEVNSKLGEGTTFEIYLPVFSKNKSHQRENESKIILLADDELMLRDLLAELLESYDFEVIRVQNGLETLKVLTEEIKVDLLIIDHQMPGMDGLTCIKIIREKDLDLPVILSTGNTLKYSADELNELKIQCVLTKPYEFEQMLEAIRSLI